MSASEPASSQASEDLRSSSQLGGSHSQVTASTQRVTQPSSSACSSSNDEASGAVSSTLLTAHIGRQPNSRLALDVPRLFAVQLPLKVMMANCPRRTLCVAAVSSR